MSDTREPIVSGSFYEASSSKCLQQANILIESADIDNCPPGQIRGGLLPHAGWTFSGKLAAITLKALAASKTPQTVIFFGADHSGCAQYAEVYDSGSWITPLGPAQIDTQAAEALIAYGPPFRSNRSAHSQEHSIEVQIPLLQALCPDTKILPISVPATELAV
ncbi:MAG: AmmeMemoRadiSam system protein B, partial [bacterium]|nr:AmmeMemoRadiSam system protein B [bacterium]